MARTFTSTNRLIASIGNASAATYGTWAIIIRPATIANYANLANLNSSGATARLGLFFWDPSNAVAFTTAYGSDSVGSTAIVTGEWWLIVGGKASGSVQPRLHLYRYSTNAWVHENGSSSLANATAPGGTGDIRISPGIDGEYLNADVAVVGFWADQALTDAEAEQLPHSLGPWLSATELFVLDQSATTQAIRSLTGESAQTTLTGTSVATNSVPILNYGDGPWLVASSGGGAPPPTNTRRYSLTLTGVG